LTPDSVFWEIFDQINLQTLKDVTVKLRRSFCPNDIIHPRFLKLIIDSVGPGMGSRINKCLKMGSVPANRTVATVTFVK